MVPHDLDPVRDIRGAMTVMKKKLLRLQRIDHLDVAAQLPVVVPGNDHHFTSPRETAQQLSRFPGRHFIVNQIAEDDQTPGPVFIHQFLEPFGDRRHSPHGNQPPGRALAQFIAKMQVCDGEPALRSVKKGEPPIQKNFIGDQRLIRS